ncbi:hypothetical protein [uncultured Paludibaculum sp.]|uniref:hypothetical protein n=1 Tax=uncultured Paludibaculum sp. TaxID=1765020 RepID=UPI002AAAF61D|nr:hypothetical protein [uncultured Paludibaculum sp.]
MSAINAFLDGILDYAGLFPPARLDLPTALGHYDYYQRHPRAHMLARFVLPLDQLDKVDPLPSRVALVCRGEAIELPELPPQIETIEYAGSLAAPSAVPVFHEIDWRDPQASWPTSGGVKLRAGGLTPDMVPPADTVERFLVEAARRALPIKFTAGLHCPVPNDDHEVGVRMHGFLNLFAAAFAAYSGETNLALLIAEAGWDDFQFTATHFHAGPFSFTLDEIVRLRREFVISFGSCSFLEPIEHLERHGFLPTESVQSD